MKYVLEIERPKVVEGLSCMHFIVKQWKEVALSDNRHELEQYRQSLGDGFVFRIVNRYGDIDE